VNEGEKQGRKKEFGPESLLQIDATAYPFPLADFCFCTGCNITVVRSCLFMQYFTQFVLSAAKLWPKMLFSNMSSVCHLEFLADRPNGHAIGTALRLSVVCRRRL